MNGLDGSRRIETVVIGGGQAGLAAGYHLAKRGVSFVILEANERVGDTWRSRYDSLRLYSPARYDGLPGLPFPLHRSAFPSGDQMADYLETYAAHFHLPVHTGVVVDGLHRADNEHDGYVVTAGDRRYEASQVIVATGVFKVPRVPEFASQLDPGICQLHSSEYRNPTQLADGAALVVGVSHSGADIAFELAHSRRTLLSGRSHGQLPVSVDSRAGGIGWTVMKFVAWNLLTLNTPIGRKMAPEVRKGGAPLLRVRRADLLKAGVEWSEARTVGVADGKPMLADGQVLDVASVIWCTGFRPDYSWIHLPIVGDDGWPSQTRGVVGSSPGLYFLGLLFQYSFTSMLVLGAGRDAAYVVDRIAQRAGSGTLATGPTAAPSPAS
jgi:putative flavoprotein involved in K+ transport